MDYELWIMDYGIRLTNSLQDHATGVSRGAKERRYGGTRVRRDYELWIMDYGLWIMDYGIRPTNSIQDKGMIPSKGGGEVPTLNGQL
jgi:hypothetical protein